MSRGVLPSSAAMSGSAPWSSSSRASVASSLCAAVCSGVKPPCWRTFGFAPASSSARTAVVIADRRRPSGSEDAEGVLGVGIRVRAHGEQCAHGFRAAEERGQVQRREAVAAAGISG